MRFIRLELLNLASLDRVGGERIDFEEGVLGKSNIFSIVGPTGSGKSTLLDAICLALYGRAPRYPRRKGERGSKIAIYGTVSKEEENRRAPTDCCNILTRGKKNGYSKLTFIANDGGVYRAEWSVRFKQKEYDDPITALYRLKPNGDVEEGDWNTIPQILGLDYDQFLRTVLIAQGTFANFLNSSEEDRYELLEKLIGCGEMYKGIAKRIKQAYETANTSYIELHTQHSTIDADLLKGEELTSVTERIKQLEEEDKKAKAELGEVSKAIDWYSTEEKYLSNISLQGEQFKTAQQKLTDYKPHIDRLAIHDATVDAVKYWLDYIGNQEKIKDLEGQLKTLGDKITAIKTAIGTGEQELLPLQQASREANAELERQKPHINTARAIKAELATLENTLNEKKAAKDKAGDAMKEAEIAVRRNADSINSLRTIKTEADTALDNLKNTIAEERKKKDKDVDEATRLFNAKADEIKGLDAITLQNASTSARDKKNDLASAIRIRKEIVEKTAKLTKDKAEVNTRTARNAIIDTELSSLHLETLRTELATLKDTHTLMTSEEWQLHRAGLTDGQPCPLCGAIHHPYKNDATFAPVVSELGELISQKTATLASLEEKAQDLNNEKSQNNGRISVLNSALRTQTSELGKLQGEWASIHAKYPAWPEDLALLESLQSQVADEAMLAEKVLNEYNKKAAEKEQLRLNKEKAEKERQDYNQEGNLKTSNAQQKATEADTALSTEMGRTQILLNQQKEKTDAFHSADEAFKNALGDVEKKKQQMHAELGDKDPDEYEKLLEKNKEDADKAVTKKSESIGELRNELSGYEGQVQPTLKQKEDEQQRESTNKGLLDRWIADYNATTGQLLSVETIKEISGYADNWAAIRSMKEKLQEALTSAQTTLGNTQKEHEAHQASKPEQDNASLTARKAELEQRENTELVGLQARMQRHQAAEKLLEPVADKMQTAKARREAWCEIIDAIGSEGKTLRKIAQCYTLGFLVEHANAEIRKFNSRYELQQVKNSLGIRVIDHDRADDVRDTTSLSGGETFIVSLGLALGLSSLSSRNIAFENLFIDEGFGTLDPDTLTTVITSLAMLQSSQGKKVGVISHTDTMSELITTQIRVHKNGNTGSSYIEITPN